MLLLLLLFYGVWQSVCQLRCILNEVTTSKVHQSDFHRHNYLFKVLKD